jgi:predicted transposase/invertase (TIGR01784 family)
MDGLNEGLVQGLTQGLVQGKVEGRMEGKTEIALRLANSNIPLDTIAEATGFSLEELKQLLKR